MNSENSIIKARIDANIFDALKEILIKKNMTQQDLLDQLVKNFILENLNLIVPTNKESK